MKYFSFLLALSSLFFFTACDGPSLSGKTVTKEYYTGGQIRTEYIMDDKAGRNGLIKRYGYEGNVISTETIRNGVKDGYMKLYNSKGLVIRIKPYVNGRVQGTQKDLYENGDILATVPYVNGVRNGVAYVYRKDGSVDRRVTFKNDRMVN